MALLIALNGSNSELPPTKGSTPATTAVARAARRSAQKAKTQAPATPPQALTSDRAAVIPSAPSSTPAKSAKKVNQTVNKTPSGPSLYGLYERVCTTRNLEIGGIVIGSAAVAAAFGVWASKVGTLAASQIIVTSTVAFLQPGLTIFGFALKTGMFITLNTVVPVMSGLVTIALPFISTIVVTAIAVFVTLYVVNKMIQQMKDSLSLGLTTMKDTVTGLPGMLLKQVPGYSFVTSLFSSEEAEEEPPSKEQELAASQKRLSNEIEQANRASGSLEHFEKLRDAAKTSGKKAKLETTVAALKGERQLSHAYKPENLAETENLADFLKESNPHKSRLLITRRAVHKEKQLDNA